MQYHTIKPNLNFWEEFIKFHAKWKKFNLSVLAKDLGFSPSYISEILNGTNKGEISTRFIGSTVKALGSTFDELWTILPVEKEPNDFVTAKTHGQVFSCDPADDERNEYQITSDQQYSAYLASLDWTQRIAKKKSA